MENPFAPRGAPTSHRVIAEPASPSAGWLTRTEVAERLHISETTVARLATTGDLDEVRFSPKCPRISAESVDRLERNGARNPAMAGSAA